MEDLSRNMGENVKPSRKRLQSYKGWTILMISENGETRKIRGFKKMVVAALSVCFISVCTALCLLYLYFDLLNENKKLNETISVSKALYGTNNSGIKKKSSVGKEKSPFEVKSYKDFLVEQNENRRYSIGYNPNLQISKEFTFMPSSSAKQALSSSYQLNKISVNDFQLIIKAKKDEFEISFTLKNKKNAKEAMTGNAFVVLTNEYETGSWLSLPEVPVKDGRPIFFKKGRAFYLARVKTVRFQHVPVVNLNMYTKATVMIYSSKGRLVMEDTYPIEILL